MLNTQFLHDIYQTLSNIKKCAVNSVRNKKWILIVVNFHGPTWKFKKFAWCTFYGHHLFQLIIHISLIHSEQKKIHEKRVNYTLFFPLKFHSDINEIKKKKKNKELFYGFGYERNRKKKNVLDMNKQMTIAPFTSNVRFFFLL